MDSSPFLIHLRTVVGVTIQYAAIPLTLIQSSCCSTRAIAVAHKVLPNSSEFYEAYGMLDHWETLSHVDSGVARDVDMGGTIHYTGRNIFVLQCFAPSILICLVIPASFGALYETPLTELSCLFYSTPLLCGNNRGLP